MKKLLEELFTFSLLLFTSSAGAISGAEFERIDIIDGKAYLDVGVYTNATLELEKLSYDEAGFACGGVAAPGRGFKRLQVGGAE